MKHKLDPSDNIFSESFDIRKIFPNYKEPTPPTFDELWETADRAVYELYETFPKQFWERAAKSQRVPIFIPRKREKFKVFMAVLKSTGVMLKGSGRTRQQDTPFSREAKAAYEKVWKERRQLRVMRKCGYKPNPSQAEVIDLLQFRTKTLGKLWMFWMVEAFMDTHNGEPEKSRKLKKIVKKRVVHQAKLKSLARPTPKAYRNEIKRDFRKAVKRLAKEMTDLMGT
jgi:hypothetical protein